MGTLLNPPKEAFLRPLSNTEEIGFYDIAKRLLDIGAASLLILMLLPTLIAAAVALKLSDFGPVFFRQIRVGRNGRRFWCYKFRTMVPNAEALKPALMRQNDHEDARTFKMKRDPRITRIGMLLRRTSIDELPQLWNVLRGEMSLVGPRPAVPSEVLLYSEADMRRLDVKPGLTCIWQVSGRGKIPFSGQLRMDIDYVESRSFWLDLKLILLTIPAVLSTRGAY